MQSQLSSLLLTQNENVIGRGQTRCDRVGDEIKGIKIVIGGGQTPCNHN